MKFVQAFPAPELRADIVMDMSFFHAISITYRSYGIILRNRTVHIVIIVLELHMDYIAEIVYESIS